MDGFWMSAAQRLIGHAEYFKELSRVCVDAGDREHARDYAGRLRSQARQAEDKAVAETARRSEALVMRQGDGWQS